jgi:hypothetical protein
MTCDVCTFGSGKGIEAFSTEKSFLRFRDSIRVLVERGDLKKVEGPGSDPLWHDFYQCCSCGELWVLAMPDQAFRGGYAVVDDGAPQSRPGAIIRRP